MLYGKRQGSAVEWQAPKKDKKDVDEEDAAFVAKKKQDEAAVKAAREKGMSCS